jgi:nitroimidazol reductase NimA-like FMN-containing flavoprotein (pyridoxamine 5'-phosphate oxidase superfamily)
MTTTQPTTELDARYSSEGATATSWEDARRALEAAEVYWISTVHPEGRPHVTPLFAVWHDGAMHFCTGQDEVKRLNIAANPQCALITGTNSASEGLDIVYQGRAVRVTDTSTLQALADAWEAKYGPEWRFEVGDGGFEGQGETTAWVFRIEPKTVHGYGKGAVFSQTRWTF